MIAVVIAIFAAGGKYATAIGDPFQVPDVMVPTELAAPENDTLPWTFSAPFCAVVPIASDVPIATAPDPYVNPLSPPKPEPLLNCMSVEEPPGVPIGVAHELSPRRYVVLLGVPVADRLDVPIPVKYVPAIAVPCQTPVAIVPSAVSDDVTTLLAKVVPVMPEAGAVAAVPTDRPDAASF